MKTKLDIGDYFRFRYRGEFDYGQIIRNEIEKQYTVLPWTSIPENSIVHNTVWVDRDMLVSRGTRHVCISRKAERRSGGIMINPADLDRVFY